MTTKLSDKINNVIYGQFPDGFENIIHVSSCENDWYEAMADFVSDRKTKQEAKAHVAEKRFFNRI